MKNLLRFFGFKNNRGMSTAISTLMTLTAAVILTGSTVLYATNVSTNAMANEKMIMPTTHVWYINSTASVGGIVLTNSGTTDAIINKITINGVNCAWAGNNSFILYNKTAGSFAGDLAFADVKLANMTISIANQPYEFQAASEGISLKSGSSMALYIATPDNIMVYDMGQPITVVVSTTQAIYTGQANVESPA